jgi:hypothetical protein
MSKLKLKPRKFKPKFAGLYQRCDVFLFPDEEGYLFVAANEAGRDAFERLFDATIDWDFDRPEVYQLPDDWKVIDIWLQLLIETSGNRLGEVAAPERTTQDRDDVLLIAYSLALHCRVILLQGNEMMAVRSSVAQLQ